MKRVLYLFIGLIVPLVIYAATTTVSGTGNWSDTGIWVGGTLPTAVDDVVMNNSTSATIQNGESFTVLSLDAGNSAILTINTGGSLNVTSNLTTDNNTVITVDGDLTIQGDLIVNNNLILNVTGSLTILGNVSLNNGADLTVDSSGSVDITGSFTGGNNTALDIDGSVSVGGDFDVGNGSTAVGTGNISVGGNCTDGGSTVCSSAVLPVKLLYFNSKIENSFIKLDWATYEEENFDYFSLEKSVDGKVWKSIGEIKGQGWSYKINNYGFKDVSPVSGLSYYRLKAVDLDGTFEYHPPIAVEFRGAGLDFNLYPNPTNDGSKIEIQLNFVPENPYKISVFDFKGNLLFSGELTQYKETVYNANELKSGIYNIRLAFDTGLILNKKLMVR